MSSLAADHFVLAECSAAAGGDEAGLLLHLHHQNHRQPEMYNHVPQHSRREKLRFTSEGLSLVQHHHPAAAASSSSPSFYNNVNSYAPLAAAPTDSQISHHHCFSLSLSSPAPSPVTPPQAPRQQQQQQLGIRPVHPLGPFTGYATVLSRSRFLNPAQDILEELCGVGSHVGVGRSGDHAVITECDTLLDADLRWHGSTASEAEHLNPSDGQQQSWRNNKLTCMLDEVYKRYKQYYQQVHDVIASFECVAGLSTAAPYASMALKLISKNFSNLKNMILDRLHHMNKVIGKCVVNELRDISGFDFAKDNNCHRRSTNNDRSFDQPQPWRPQRGLPESAVSVLRAWLFQHFLHPYPTDTDKQMLAKQTGLTRNQVSNWFINARVRLWKPMVEEVHSLESQQKHKAPTAAEHLNTDEECRRPPTKVTRTGRNHDVKCRSNQQEAFDMPNMVALPITMSSNDLSDHQDIGIGTSIDTTLGSSGVSLTLGLHQNRVVQFAEQLPVFDDCMDSYSLSINPEQGRSIGKSVSNHLFGDLVG